MFGGSFKSWSVWGLWSYAFCVNNRVYIRVSKCYEIQRMNCIISSFTLAISFTLVEPLTTCIEQLIVRLDKFGLINCIREDSISK